MEKELFKFLNSIWKNLSDNWQVVFLIAFVLLIISFSFKYIWPPIAQIIEKRKEKKKSDIESLELEKHPIFSQISYWTKYKINSLDFGDDKRDKLFKQIIMSETLSFEKNIKDIIIKKQVNDMSDYDFKEYMLQNYFAILAEYNEEFEKVFHKNIYSLVIGGKNGFNQWKEDSITYTKKTVESICESTFYHSNKEKVWTIFNSYQSALDSTILVVEKTFYAFNGNLTRELNKLE